MKKWMKWPESACFSIDIFLFTASFDNKFLLYQACFTLNIKIQKNEKDLSLIKGLMLILN